MIVLVQELQQLVFDTLINDAALQTMIARRVYDFIPQTSVFPYIRIGDFSFGDGGTKDVRGMDGEFSVHSWTESERGNLMLTRILGRVYDMFTNKSLRMQTSVASCIRMSHQTIIPDPDGIHRHGLIKFTTNLYEDSSV